jgi:hypothetical protein
MMVVVVVAVLVMIDILGKFFLVMKHSFPRLGMLIAKTAEHRVLKIYIPSTKIITLLKSQSMLCCLSVEDNWIHFHQSNSSSRTLLLIESKFNFLF